MLIIFRSYIVTCLIPHREKDKELSQRLKKTFSIFGLKVNKIIKDKFGSCLQIVPSLMNDIHISNVPVKVFKPAMIKVITLRKMFTVELFLFVGVNVCG